MAFQEALLGLAAVPPCCVVLTARADFYPELMASPLWPEVRRSRLEVAPLDEAGLRQAILGPAATAGVYVEAALVERLVADSAGEPGVLPLVQETLVLLWERMERRFLPLRAYEALVLPRHAYGGQAHGVPRTGLQVAMARRADAAFAALTPSQQAIARRVFLRLVQFGEGRADTRRRQPVAALRAAGDDPRQVDATLNHLADRRLLTLSGGNGSPHADLAHEALIEGWPQLQQWLGRAAGGGAGAAPPGGEGRGVGAAGARARRVARRDRIAGGGALAGRAGRRRARLRRGPTGARGGERSRARRGRGGA